MAVQNDQSPTIIPHCIKCDGLTAQVSQLENENHDLQRKLGILEKETSGFFNILLESCSPTAADVIRSDLKTNYTAIATLLEQP